MDAPGQETESVLAVDDIESAVHVYTRHLGYRLEMIAPADAPTVAILRRDDVRLKLEKSRNGHDKPVDSSGGGENHLHPIISKGGEEAEWTSGRAGMEYRDLIPGRLDGAL